VHHEDPGSNQIAGMAVIGREIGSFLVREELGRGGMGVVWRAEDTTLERLVALKTTPLLQEQTGEQRRRFIGEARSAARINHPNVAQVCEIRERENELLIVMEYIQGGSVADRLQSGTGQPPSIEQLVSWARQTAEGLAEAHNRGIIHRDIKPANLMLDEHGWLKITDFGLARLAAEPTPSEGEADTGTIGYMSPEQIQGGTIDHRSDLFSLGATLYEMFTGKRPFAGANLHEIHSAVLGTEPIPPCSLRPELHSRLEKIILKLLEKNPADRYQDTEAVVFDLIAMQTAAGYLTGIETPTLRGKIGEHASIWYRSRRRALRLGTVLIGALTALLIALMSYGLLQGVFNSFENRTWDARIRFSLGLTVPHDPDSGLFLIRIDNRATQKYGGFARWPASRYGELTMALSGWGATAVCFDIPFADDDSLSGTDQTFVPSMVEAGMVGTTMRLIDQTSFLFDSTIDSFRLAATLLNHTIPIDLVSGADSLPDLAEGMILSSPGPGVEAASKGIGLSDLHPDPDGVVRRHSLLIRYHDRLIPSTAFRIFLDVMRIEPGDLRLTPGRFLIAGEYRFPVDSRGRLLLHWYPANGNPFRELSFYDVLEGRVGQSEDVFEGSINLVGATAPGFLDAHTTPLSSGNPGTLIHTVLLANLMRHEYGTVMGEWLGSLFVILLGAIGGLLAMQFRIARGSVYLVVLMLGTVVLAYFLCWRWTYWLELFRPLMGCLFGYLAALVYRYRPGSV